MLEKDGDLFIMMQTSCGASKEYVTH